MYQEHIWHAWNHKMFRVVRAVFDTNEELSNEGGFLFQWMADGYLDASLMLLRRELDLADGTENLRNLLLDMQDHAPVISRSRYHSRVSPNSCLDAGFIDRLFDGFRPFKVEGDSNKDHFDPVQIKADLDQVTKDAEAVRVYAERTRAHRTPTPKGEPLNVTIGEMHTTILDIRRVVGKYYTLLTQNSISDWEPAAQFSILKPFEKPWVLDAKAVNQAEEKAGDG